MQAVIFDCDGVLVDTERDGHRVAFNTCFRELGWPVEWSIERYGQLLSTAGGKERMRRHFDETGWPVPPEDGDTAIAQAHKVKTDRFMELIEGGGLPLRPGIARLVGQAIDADLTIAICSTSNERAVQLIVDKMFGAQSASHIRVFAGDIVPRKKPDPAIYRLAAETLGLDPAKCAVIEDSNIGLRAAKAAGMACLVTLSSYTAQEDFSLANRIVSDLDHGPGPIGIEDLRALLA